MKDYYIETSDDNKYISEISQPIAVLLNKHQSSSTLTSISVEIKKKKITLVGKNDKVVKRRSSSRVHSSETAALVAPTPAPVVQTTSREMAVAARVAISTQSNVIAVQQKLHRNNTYMNKLLHIDHSVIKKMEEEVKIQFGRGGQGSQLMDKLPNTFMFLLTFCDSFGETSSGTTNSKTTTEQIPQNSVGTPAQDQQQQQQPSNLNIPGSTSTTTTTTATKRKRTISQKSKTKRVSKSKSDKKRNNLENTTARQDNITNTTRGYFMLPGPLSSKKRSCTSNSNTPRPGPLSSKKLKVSEKPLQVSLKDSEEDQVEISTTFKREIRPPLLEPLAPQIVDLAVLNGNEDENIEDEDPTEHSSLNPVENPADDGNGGNNDDIKVENYFSEKYNAMPALSPQSPFSTVQSASTSTPTASTVQSVSTPTPTAPTPTAQTILPPLPVQQPVEPSSSSVAPINMPVKLIDPAIQRAEVEMDDIQAKVQQLKEDIKKLENDMRNIGNGPVRDNFEFKYNLFDDATGQLYKKLDSITIGSAVGKVQKKLLAKHHELDKLIHSCWKDLVEKKKM